MNDETCEITVDLIHETDSAVLVKDCDDVQHWLPKSKIVWIDGEMGGSVTLELPVWLATERGLI